MASQRSFAQGGGGDAASGNSAKGRIAIGVGTRGSQGALSIGYGKRIGDRGSFSPGASFSSGKAPMGGASASTCNALQAAGNAKRRGRPRRLRLRR